MSGRVARPRRYLMCRPDHFAVDYAINPWMDPAAPVSRERAVAQWEALRGTYDRLGHEVELVEPVPGLPDMVFAANGGLVVGERAVAPRFLHPQRRGEEAAYAARLGGAPQTVAHNEGEGDLRLVGGLLLAGWGFRTDLAAHAEVQELLGLPVISLRLVDPRYYHLDTALAVLDDDLVAYLPEAFSPGSRQVLERLHPDAVIAAPEDAAVLGLNMVSDGRHVVMGKGTTWLAQQVRERGFEVLELDVSELRKAGGGAKCCTLERHPAPVGSARR